jgi:hypothetical protein
LPVGICRRSALKAENYTVAIAFVHYNFVRIHQVLWVMAAMAARITPRLWEMSDMVEVLEERAARQ